jgi:RNA polymerase sigma-70 factor (ECF subfamily)
MDISREILIKAAQGGISEFEALYKAAAGFVYTVALRVTANEQDAQEVTQDVFLKIHKKLKDFRFRSSFKTWVYRITVNTALNTLRRT